MSDEGIASDGAMSTRRRAHRRQRDPRGYRLQSEGEGEEKAHKSAQSR